MRRRILVVLVAGAAALGIASCGGDDETTTTTTEPTTTTTTGATGATGEEGAVDGGAEGEAAVQDLLEQAFAAQGLTEGESSCVAELVAPEVSGEDVTDLQDPAYVEGLLGDVESEIQECEGQ